MYINIIGCREDICENEKGIYNSNVRNDNDVSSCRRNNWKPRQGAGTIF